MCLFPSKETKTEDGISIDTFKLYPLYTKDSRLTMFMSPGTPDTSCLGCTKLNDPPLENTDITLYEVDL